MFSFEISDLDYFKAIFSFAFNQDWFKSYTGEKYQT